MHRPLTILLCLTLILLTAGCAHFAGTGASDATAPAVPAATDSANGGNGGFDPQGATAGSGEPAGIAGGLQSADALGSPQSHAAIDTHGDADHDGPLPDPMAAEVHGTQHELDEALEFCESAQEFWQKGDLESALEALDKAYSLILSIDAESADKLVQQKEDLRFLISKRILEIYASRNIVVSGNHNAIPREINRNVQKEIDLFTKGPEKEFFIAAYRRSGKYRPMILEKLKAAGMPPELSWLPLIESGFKVQALSRARALGLWQFIPSTGYKFGLKRNQYIDERIDFEKATDAAIAYLKELHGIFGDWSTVLAAYNCGEGRVLHVIRTQNINYLDDFWDLYGRLPFETARYVPRFLAALHVIEHKDTYGFADVMPDPPLVFERADVNRAVHLKDIAPVLDSSLAVLKDLNPELRYSVLPPEAYSLRVPVGKGAPLVAAIDTIPRSTPPQPSYAYHRVRRGETLSTIARRYHSSVRRIMLANNLRRSGYIVTGQRLRIPRRGMVVARASSSTPSAHESTTWTGRHVVKRGDSLWIIAKRYATTAKKIQEVNHLRSTMLSINQVLRVPSSAPASTASASGSGTYSVRRGESPYLIARKHNMSLNHFLRLNNLSSSSTIYPGQQVRVD
jgi:membrane-bound lytic murein transglycosylase D